MKKSTVFIISVVLIGAFAALVTYGFKRPGGIPVIVEAPKKESLEVPFIDSSIDLSKGIGLDKWNSLSSKEFELMYQLMVLPWGKSLVSPVTVKSFHNGKDIYFYVTWKDDTEDKEASLDAFPDASAVMFALSDDAAPSTVMMGFLGGANIWQWKADKDDAFWLKKLSKVNPYVDFHYPFEEEELFVVSKKKPQSAVSDLMAIRIGTITPKETQNVQGRGYWINGFWHVVFKRSLAALDTDSDARFDRGGKRMCAFAIWNGSAGDRGGRKSISSLVELVIQ